MTPKAIDQFVDRYVKALRDDTAAVFAGAGLSIPAGLVDWKTLLRGIADEIGLDVDQEHDLVSLAQYHVNERGGRHRINQALIEEFCTRAKTTENHRILASLPIRTFWTTNYDALIEQALIAARKKPDIKITVENLATTLPRRDAIVYKMHGDASQPDRAILTKDDYEAYEASRGLFSTVLRGDLVSKTFLFIGFGFSDPNLNYILSRIRILLGENRREHYCLLRRVQQEDFRTTTEFQYACAKQDLQVRDLQRYGITGLVVDKYSDYTDVLLRVKARYQMGRVFISGSAATYDPWNREDARRLVHEIAARLIRAEFELVSGFGRGVGGYIINGVLEELAVKGITTIDGRLLLRPFPTGVTDRSERKRRLTAYREDMLSHAGIAVFLFGNRRDENGVVSPADGVEEEFRLAVQQGLRVVPVGCTGSTAAGLWKEVARDFTAYFPRGCKQLFDDLDRRGTASEVAERLVTFLIRLRDG